MHARRLFALRIPLLGVALLSILVLAAACSGSDEAGPDSGSAPPEQAAQNEGGSQAVETGSRAVEGLLAVEPASGHVGDEFAVSGEDFPPGAEVTLSWITWDGYYETEILEAGPTKFFGARYDEVETTLGTARADQSGKVEAAFVAPADYGGAHDIYASVDGEKTHRGGFQIRRSVSVSPEEGPVGTPITITVEGMDRFAFGRQMSVRYNNQYAGFITGVTNQGTATATLRAAGPPGIHTIDMSGGGVHGGGFLTNHQSPYANQYPETGAYRFLFRVTDDPGPSDPVIEWPKEGRVAELAPGDNFPTAVGVGVPSSMTFDISPLRGPVGTPIDIRVTGLDPGNSVIVDWATTTGSGGGQAQVAPDALRLGEFETDDIGTLEATVEAPNQLGGWHAIQIVVDGQVVAERGFYTERSLVSVPEGPVRVGEPFTIELLGGGLYDLDSAFAVTYNNAYMGYGCGFTARGPVTFHMIAAGQPGTHFVDIYPMTYRGVGGSGEDPWGFQMPHLNATEDHPGLDQGMTLPIIRVAIEVVE